MATNITSELISTLGPSDDHRKEIQRSWFGTLLGQTTVAVGMVIIYFAAIGFLYDYVGDELESLHRSNPLVFYGGIAAPLAFVGIFSLLPAALRARREHRLKPLSHNPLLPKPGYFRLHPFEIADSSDFQRIDGALEEAFLWINNTKSSILYFTGASGSGKSSLINAGLAPRVRSIGWEVLFVRGMGKPHTAIIEGLRKASHLFEKSPPTNANLRELLTLASEERSRVGAGPLLIVMDQFEEFLLLDQGEEKEKYAEQLHELEAEPVANIHILHVFRSDYRDLIFRENLPKYVDRDTAFSLAGFTRRDAETYLNAGPVQLNASGYNDLFVGLDRIEEARGIYRPITLNMVGFVLERQGDTLSTEPAQLIERYLSDCINFGEAKDFSSSVLGALITREGTKIPRTDLAIAELAQLQTWQVNATLSSLAEQGLVRKIDTVWEISHDFVAKVLGRIISRRTWRSNVHLLSTPALLVIIASWTLTLAVGLPTWTQYRERIVLDRIYELGFYQDSKQSDNGLAFGFRGVDISSDREFDDDVDLSDEELREFSALASELGDVSRLEIFEANFITDLSPISKLSSLNSLSLSWMDGLEDLGPLSTLTLLEELSFFAVSNIDDLEPISRLPNLKHLAVNMTTGVTDLRPLANAQSLQTLQIDSLDVEKIEPLSRLHDLYALALVRTQVADLNAISQLTNLEYLDLTGSEWVTDLTDLASLQNLTILKLGYVNSYTSLSPVDRLPALRELTILSMRGAPPESLLSLADLDCSVFQRIDHDVPQFLLETCIATDR